jgi:hypothetical protein
LIRELLTIAVIVGTKVGKKEREKQKSDVIFLLNVVKKCNRV